MDINNHISDVLDPVTALMKHIDGIPYHPKNKLLLYHFFVLSKSSWHFAIASLGKTWAVESIGNIVASYFLQ